MRVGRSVVGLLKKEREMARSEEDVTSAGDQLAVFGGEGIVGFAHTMSPVLNFPLIMVSFLLVQIQYWGRFILFSRATQILSN